MNAMNVARVGLGALGVAAIGASIADVIDRLWPQLVGNDTPIADVTTKQGWNFIDRQRALNKATVATDMAAMSGGALLVGAAATRSTYGLVAGSGLLGVAAAARGIEALIQRGIDGDLAKRNAASDGVNMSVDFDYLDRDGDGTLGAQDVSRTNQIGSALIQPAYDRLSRDIDGPLTRDAVDAFVKDFNTGKARPSGRAEAAQVANGLNTIARWNPDLGQPERSRDGADLVAYSDLEFALMQDGRFARSQAPDWTIDRDVTPDQVGSEASATIAIARAATGVQALRRQDMVSFFDRAVDTDRNGRVSVAEDDAFRDVVLRPVMEGAKTISEAAGPFKPAAGPFKPAGS